MDEERGRGAPIEVILGDLVIFCVIFCVVGVTFRLLGRFSWTEATWYVAGGIALRLVASWLWPGSWLAFRR